MSRTRTLAAKSLTLAFSVSILTGLVVHASVTGCGGSTGPTTYPPATIPAVEPVRPKPTLEANEDEGKPVPPVDTFIPASKAGPPIHLKKPASATPHQKAPAPASSGKH